MATRQREVDAFWIEPKATTKLKDYPPGTILVVEVGSTAHGTGLDGMEDHDEMVVFIPPPESMLGIDPKIESYMWRTAPDGVKSGPEDVDRQIYSLDKFIHLAYAGNPSILTGFWAPLLVSNGLGRRLRALGPAFVGRHVIPRYRGYMMGQLARMEGKKAGHGALRSELVAVHGYDTKYAMHAARLGFQGTELVTTGRLALPIAGDPGDWLRMVRRGEVPYDEWRRMVSGLDIALEQVGKDKQYRAGPDVAAINAFCLAAYREAWKWK